MNEVNKYGVAIGTALSAIIMYGYLIGDLLWTIRWQKNDIKSAQKQRDAAEKRGDEAYWKLNDQKVELQRTIGDLRDELEACEKAGELTSKIEAKYNELLQLVSQFSRAAERLSSPPPKDDQPIS
jgi:chromosome segregation ATPase